MVIFDYISIPFGYMMDGLYRVTNNYGVAIMLFAVLVTLVMYPMNLRNNINAYKRKRLSPHVTVIRGMYPGNLDMQNRMMEHMYRNEKVSLSGGCLLSIIPVIILISMFCVIYSPIQFIFHEDATTAKEIVAHIRTLDPALFGNSRGYSELIAAQHIPDYAESIRAAFPDLTERAYEGIDFCFLGIDMASAPQLDFTKWTDHSWGTIGLFLLPILMIIVQALPSIIAYIKKVIAAFKGKTNENGAFGLANLFQLFSLVMMVGIAFVVPGVLCLYWITKSATSHLLNIYTKKKILSLPPDPTDLKELEKICLLELGRKSNEGFTEYAE